MFVLRAFTEASPPIMKRHFFENTGTAFFPVFPSFSRIFFLKKQILSRSKTNRKRHIRLNCSFVVKTNNRHATSEGLSDHRFQPHGHRHKPSHWGPILSPKEHPAVPDRWPGPLRQNLKPRTPQQRGALPNLLYVTLNPGPKYPQPQRLDRCLNTNFLAIAGSILST